MEIDFEDAVIPEWTLGDRLRKAREHARLSQGELAAKIGISMTSVSRYETDRTTPNQPVLLSWAICTDCDAGWLAGQGVRKRGWCPARAGLLVSDRARLGLAA